MKMTCPFCDSQEVEKIKAEESFTVPFCEDAHISYEAYRCNNCGEEGDFDNSQEKALTLAIDKANIAAAPKLMDDLTKIGITMTYFEKALRLPFRTTSRWKRGEISHSSLALLRLIRFSPSLLAVADDNFSHSAIACYQLSRPWDFFKRNTINPEYHVTYEQNQVGISFNGNLNSSVLPSVKQEVEWNTEWEVIQ